MTRKNRHLEKKVCMADFKSKKSLNRRKNKSRKYLRAPNFVMWMNQEKIDIKKFDDKSIVRKSETQNVQFDNTKATWFSGFYEENMLEDETEYLNIGIPTERKYNYIDIKGIAQPSYYNDYPYNTKVISFHLFANSEMKILGRETYSVLEFLGDMGGLNDALQIIFGMLIAPFATLQLQSMLANKLFTADSKYLRDKDHVYDLDVTSS